MQEILVVIIFSLFSFVAGAARERVLTEKRNREIGILSGKDAERFLKQIKENENEEVSPEELERIKKNYEIMKSIVAKSNL